jgi:hypothetical protein
LGFGLNLTLELCHLLLPGVFPFRALDLGFVIPPLPAISRQPFAYIGIVRGGIMMMDGKGGDAL